MNQDAIVKPVIFDARTIDEKDLSALTREYATDQELKDMIDRLPINLGAEGKVILYNVLHFSVQVGKTIIRVGKKVVEYALMLAERYPNATFGLIVAGILTALIALIPVLGPALASLLGPLMAIFGLVGGFWKDVRESSPRLARDVDETVAIFSPLDRAA